MFIQIFAYNATPKFFCLFLWNSIYFSELNKKKQCARIKIIISKGFYPFSIIDNLILRLVWRKNNNKDIFGKHAQCKT